jgi:hypothetical protein
MKITKGKLIIGGILCLMLAKFAYQYFDYYFKVEQINENQLKLTASYKLLGFVHDVYNYDIETDEKTIFNDNLSLAYSQGENERTLIMSGASLLEKNHVYKIILFNKEERWSDSSLFCIRSSNVISTTTREAEKLISFAQQCQEQK